MFLHYFLWVTLHDFTVVVVVVVVSERKINPEKDTDILNFFFLKKKKFMGKDFTFTHTGPFKFTHTGPLDKMKGLKLKGLKGLKFKIHSH